MRMLIEKGANINAVTDNNNNSALLFATMKGNISNTFLISSFFVEKLPFVWLASFINHSENADQQC